MNRPPQRTERGRGEPGDERTPEGSPARPATLQGPRKPRAWGPGPRTSRRRGPGENSTGRLAVARRFRHTPRGYGIGGFAARRERWSELPASRLTPRNGPPYHPPDDERAVAPPCANRVRGLPGSDVDPGPSGEDHGQSR